MQAYSWHNVKDPFQNRHASKTRWFRSAGKILPVIVNNQKASHVDGLLLRIGGTATDVRLLRQRFFGLSIRAPGVANAFFRADLQLFLARLYFYAVAIQSGGLE
ncbi:hypothetical protein ACFQWF_29695 [Methylorubrum suomiense]